MTAFANCERGQPASVQRGGKVCGLGQKSIS
jgi:hypothetical protein